MCGIVGYVGGEQAAPLLLRGLRRLEYRGYDSAGMAVAGDAGIRIVKTEGRVERLAAMTENGKVMQGRCGIGHTRWATHGRPDTCNAHPHASEGNRVVLVHNGIIENYREIAEELKQIGYVFRSRTDTEAAALLLDRLYGALQGQKMPPRERALSAIRTMMRRIRGSYALAILFDDQPEMLYAACQSSPLALSESNGQCEGRMLASDVTAMLGTAQRVVYMRDGEIACLSAETMQLFDAQGRPISREGEIIGWTERAADKGGYAHFMRKEIDEQVRAVQDTLAPRIVRAGAQRIVDLRGDGLEAGTLVGVSRVYLIGCGSAYHAACVGKTVLQQLARVPCEAELASEFRYSSARPVRGALAVIISQSGETADSLAALRMLKARGVRTLAIVNVAGSAIAREADAVMLTHAGPEIAVATTKAYSAQLAALYLLAVRLAAERGAIDVLREERLVEALFALPEKIEETIGVERDVRLLSKEMARQRDIFFIGRGVDHAACMEGSLKLKEVSYIHAEAYAAGELKHGTISLIEPGISVIVVATQKALMDKTLANAAEARSRGAAIILITTQKNAETDADRMILLPETEPLFLASLAAIPMQLLAYHVSCAKGLDVDRPRNLAKSVTVE